MATVCFSALNTQLRTSGEYLKLHHPVKAIGNGLIAITSFLNQGEDNIAKQLHVILKNQFEQVRSSHQRPINSYSIWERNPHPQAHQDAVTAALLAQTQIAIDLADSTIKRFLEEKNPHA